MAGSEANERFDVAVIGAGVIGVSVALFLAEAGRRVALVDRRGVAREASSGNAGAFAFSDILPLASPDTILKAPRWLFDPLGPLSIPPAYLPRLAPWLLRFLLAGAPARFRRSVDAQAALMSLSEAETDALLDRHRLGDQIASRGALHLYENQRAFRKAAGEWEMRAARGIAFERLDRAGIEARQPGLAPFFADAVFVPGWRNVADPHAYAQTLADLAAERGARLIEGEIVEIAPGGDGVRLGCADGSRIEADQAVVSAGAWSHRLAALVGDRIPLETERGYNTTLAPDAFDLKCQLIFEEHGFVVSPLAVGLRVGGAVELGGLDRPPDYRRSQTMLAKAARFMPGLRAEGGTQWMGFRPSTPDSLPVIGRSTRAPRLVHALGHGHLGLTQSAGTARLVADILLNRAPPIPLASYSPDRF